MRIIHQIFKEIMKIFIRLFLLVSILLWNMVFARPIKTADTSKTITPEVRAKAVTATNENASLQGRWGKGPTYAVAAEGKHVYFGDGAEFISATINSHGEISEQGRVVLPASLKDIEVSSSGNYAYVAMGYQGVAVVDIRSSDDPQLVNVLTNANTDFDAKAISKLDDRLFIAAGRAGIVDARIWAVDSIVFGGTYSYENCYMEDVAVNGDGLIFSASNSGALEVLRYSTGSFALLNKRNYNQYTDSHQNSTPSAQSVFLQNDSLYIADAWTGVFFFTYQDTVLNFMGYAAGGCENVIAKGNYIYTTDYYNINVFSAGSGGPVFRDSKPVPTSMQLARSNDYVMVASKGRGLYTFDNANQASLNEAGFFATSSLTYGVFRQGYYLYRITPINTLDIINVHNPANPYTTGHLALGGDTEEARKIFVDGDTAIVYSYDYMAGADKIYFVDVGNPSDPQTLAVYTPPSADYSISGIVSKGKVLFAAMGTNISAIDFSDLNQIQEIGNTTTSGWIEDLSLQGNYIFTASEDIGMSVVDISDPANPQEKTTFRESDMDYYVRIRIQDSYAYIADSYVGLKIIDISNPLTPVLAGSFTQADGDFNADQIAVSGNYAYIQRGWGEIIFLNVSNPAEPQLKGVYHSNGAMGLSAYSRMVYVAEASNGIYAVSNDNPDALAPCHVAGEVSGEWTCSKIYVESDLTIPPGDTLRISDSVEWVIFLGPYQIKVEGVLLAIGPENERTDLNGEQILFSGSGWHGIYFHSLNGTGQGTSVIENCRFDYADKMDITYQGGGAIDIYNSDNVIVRHCVFYRNNARLGGAIYMENSDAHIEDCYFEINGRGGVNTSEIYTTAGGALFVENSNPYLHRLTFLNNGSISGGGAVVLSNSSPTMSNILLAGNRTLGLGGAIEIASNINGASPKIVNMSSTENTAEPYGGTLHIVGENTHLEIINSILYADTKPEIYLESGVKGPTVTWSIVDSAASESWFGEGCIEDNPYFAAGVEYRLANNSCDYSSGNTAVSPAIDAGHPDSVDTFLDCSAGLGTSRADMGFYGGRYADTPTALGADEAPNIPIEFSLAQNYPNPFNPSTEIRYQLPVQSRVTLTVYNALGREVKQLLNARQSAGKYRVVFDAHLLASGVYFYRLSTERGFTAARKMILLR